jgi:hypothetical protein
VYTDYYKQNALINELKNFLKKEYISLEIEKFVIKENVTKELCEIELSLLEKSKIEVNKVIICGTGKGPINAFYNGLINHYKNFYNILHNIDFIGFSLNGVLDDSKKTDAKVLAEIIIKNDKNIKCYFKSESYSLNVAGLNAIKNIIEFYINCEQSSIILKKLIIDAKNRKRDDLINEYTVLLSNLIQHLKLTNLF